MKNKILPGLTLLFIISVVFVIWVFKPSNTHESEIYIKTGDNTDSLYTDLVRHQSIDNKFTYKVAKSIMRFNKVYPGWYKIQKGMTNRELINLFKYGQQMEVEFRFGNNILPHELYGALGRKFEADSLEFAKAINNKERLDVLGLDSNSVLAMFWADTYKFPWSISPDKMVRKFVNDQQIFWDEQRFNKLTKTGLKSSREVYILATIIEKEASIPEELPIMAGVYLNRLKIGMPLQADPTLKYAIGNSSLQRITGILKTKSAYNTYTNTGLPPGPIGIATKGGVDAVLNFQQHEYIYFCAKEDFSGAHYFTKSYLEHVRNARKYRKALDARGIK